MLVAASFVLIGAAGRASRSATTEPRGQASGQRPTFSSQTQAVRIDALVTDGGRPVLGLQPVDFEVRDNGVLQQVDLVSFDRVPLTVILTFDTSESVAGQRLRDLTTAAGSVLEGLHAEDEAALVTFGAAVARTCEATTDHRRVASALDEVKTGRGTALVDAVYAGITLGADETGRVLMIVFSDGLDTSSWLAPDSVIRTARRSDVVAYVATVGGRALPAFEPRARADYEGAMKRVLDSRVFLKDLTDATGGAVFDLAATRDLGGAFTRILAEFRQRYLLSYVPRNVSHDGWHKVEVSIKGRRGVTVKARSGYQGH
jgi:Ca-activated chloride channel family protein